MSTKNRRSSFSCSSASSSSSSSCSSLSSSLVRRQAVVTMSKVTGRVSNNGTKLSKKRPPLGNITNQINPDQNVCRNSAAICVTANVAKTRKGVASKNGTNYGLRALPPPVPQAKAPTREEFPAQVVEVVPATASAAMDGCSMAVSPSHSDGMSISLDETMSTSGSMRSPEIEYMDNDGPPSIFSERKLFRNVSISSDEEATPAGCLVDNTTFQRDTPICFDDDSFNDPQWCSTISCDIYKHLRASEMKKRPSAEYMERIQKDITASMRAVLIDWLVEVAEEYRLVSDTLYLAVNYIDRYLSGNSINRKRLQLLGVTCMMIAAKYEEICAPHVEEFCYITENTYHKDEVLEMESSVLKYLKFELTATTVKCFLRHFVRAARNSCEGRLPSPLKMEFLASYLAELTLLDYSILASPPSLTAASSVFLALFILSPSTNPWNRTLQGYTLYRPSDLRGCVDMLHQLCRKDPGSALPAIREKYSQHQHKFVATVDCPPSIPSLFFNDVNL